MLDLAILAKKKLFIIMWQPTVYIEEINDSSVTRTSEKKSMRKTFNEIKF